MAPKPTPKSKGKAAAKDAAKPAHDPDADFRNSGAAPENKAQVISRVSLVGLPNQSADAEDAIIQLLNIKYEKLAQIFAYYGKMSECETVDVATRIKLGAREGRPLLDPMAVQPRLLPQRSPQHRSPAHCFVCRWQLASRKWSRMLVSSARSMTWAK